MGRPGRKRGRWLERAIPALVTVFVLFNLAALVFWFRDPGNQTAREVVEAQGAEEAISHELSVTTSLPPLREQTAQLRGVPIGELVKLSSETIAKVRETYARGQKLGRDPRAFSKIGDSTIESPHFIDRLDQGGYIFGEFDYLQPVVDHFQGSFARQGTAVQRGLHTWSLFDPMWAPEPDCRPGEGPVDCEVRLHNPGLVIIRLGSNDVGRAELFEESLRALTGYCLANGVIPVIGTKADRNEGSNQNNEIMRLIAAEQRLPLWDFDRIAQTLPGNGMRPDGVHLTYFDTGDYTQTGALDSGYAVHNLTALMMLYEILRVLP